MKAVFDSSVAFIFVCMHAETYIECIKMPSFWLLLSCVDIPSGFSLNKWLEENSLKLSELRDTAIDQLLTTLGIKEYLLPQQCDVIDDKTVFPGMQAVKFQYIFFRHLEL